MLSNRHLLHVAEGVLIASVGFHLSIAPYTKVEESFNIQAIHDILNYGVSDQSVIRSFYDHSKFPGVVPRTFIGSLVIAAIANALNKVTALFGVDLFYLADGTQMNVLNLCRAILGLFNIFGFLNLAKSLNRISTRTKRSISLEPICFLLILCSQFHLLFYSSRTLPNFIALPLVSYGLSKILLGNMSGLAWLAFTGIVFRMEIGLLAGVILIVSSFGFGQSRFSSNLTFIVAGVLVGALMSFGIDSYFWGFPVLPELASFHFNIMQRKSVQWGVEPYKAYFSKYLLQLFRPPIVLVLAVAGFLRDPIASSMDSSMESSPDSSIESPAPVLLPEYHPSRNAVRILTASCLLFIALISFQPHKEWRFIIYVAPVLSLQAAVGLAHITRLKIWSSRVLAALMYIALFGGLILSLFMGFASSFNYPGGEALKTANDLVHSSYSNKPILVHMDVAPCMTGINLFGQIHSQSVTYDKTENETVLPQILQSASLWISSNHTVSPDWSVASTIHGFGGLNIGHALKSTMALEKSILSIVNLVVSIKKQSIADFLRQLIITKPAFYVLEKRLFIAE